MSRIEERADELRKLNISREKAIELLKKNYSKYHETYYMDITSDWPGKDGTGKITVPPKPQKPPQEVRVVGFDMPFGDMVIFMIKWAIAAIPAAIILFLIGFIISILVAGMATSF